MTVLATDRVRNTCSRCGAAGHNARTCPDPIERCTEIAELREEADGRAIEIVEYEAVIDRCLVRITESRRRIADIGIRIARLRGGA